MINCTGKMKLFQIYSFYLVDKMMEIWFGSVKMTITLLSSGCIYRFLQFIQFCV